MKNISTTVSGPIVRRMSQVLGAERTLLVLGISAARLAAFESGRGRLTETQQKRIATGTGQVWQAWAAEAAEAMAQTESERTMVAEARAIFGSPPSATTAKPRRSTLLGTASRRRPKPAA